MRSLTLGLLVPVLLAISASARFLMYIDEWHPTRPTDPEDRAGIDHVILSFVHSKTFQFNLNSSIDAIRNEFPDAKIMAAVGGWGDNEGFDEATKTEAGMTEFANKLKDVVTRFELDGVDIDWEYPGGNGGDYKDNPNSEKQYQIEAFPKFLGTIRDTIGEDKLLSIAVPAKKTDMIAYTPENGPKIWEEVDFINIMSYDIMNRRDNVTGHHTSVQGAAEAVDNYLDVSAPAEKINLGFAYYAKFFTTQDDCGTGVLGCAIVPAEDPVSGNDTKTSGAYTFEKFHMQPADTSNLGTASDGTCGPELGTMCSIGCCSEGNWCGTSLDHCGAGCQYAFSPTGGCTGPDIAGSWQKAMANERIDEEAGAAYAFDDEQNLFWTWDSEEIIRRKFRDIKEAKNLGGVFAWSLGEDSFDWSHVRLMAEEVAKGAAQGPSEPSQSAQPAQPVHSSQTVQPSSPSQPTQPAQTAQPPESEDYVVVWVDENGERVDPPPPADTAQGGCA